MILKKPTKPISGLLPINKSIGATSFSLVKILRKLTNVSKIGHAGTLDPFASGVMLLLIGKNYTTRADELVVLDKEYFATVSLGTATNTYDTEGNITNSSDYIPKIDEIKDAIDQFQNDISQIPPMFSAKKVNGKKLYELARKGITIERKPQIVNVKTTLISYDYPTLTIQVKCSKGTYIRSIANDLGEMLNTYGHLSSLTRLRVGPYLLEDCIDQKDLNDQSLERFICTL